MKSYITALFLKKKKGGMGVVHCKAVIVLQLLDLQTSKRIVITAIIVANFTESGW